MVSAGYLSLSVCIYAENGCVCTFLVIVLLGGKGMFRVIWVAGRFVRERLVILISTEAEKKTEFSLQKVKLRMLLLFKCRCLKKFLQVHMRGGTR